MWDGEIRYFFFFNDTATTEIYTIAYTLSYTTLFRSFARTRKPGHDNELVAGDNEVDVFEIMGAGAPNFDLIHSPFPD